MGVKRTSLIRSPMSVNDPKRTLRAHRATLSYCVQKKPDQQYEHRAHANFGADLNAEAAKLPPTEKPYASMVPPALPTR
jgi:hypothetical protein